MPINEFEYANESLKLENTLGIIKKKISQLGSQLIQDEEKALEFKKFIWDSHTELDPAEMRSLMSDNDVEIAIMMNKGSYLQKLYKVQNKPYFGRIVFTSNDELKEEDIYIGITHVEENLNYLVHDWRSPICSMFYDYETGPAKYEAPVGVIEGTINKKRQYTIEDGKLIHIFDNEVNIDDELLQEVLANESNDKMKNIVNTIQKEQNKVIRNIEDKNLIVQGIAGSGKTSVALHRIAFLLYKLEYLSSKNVLILSPNNVFSEYISNVLPELGEENTKETTLNEFLSSYLKEFKQVESFTSFIERYYQNKELINYDLISYKVGDNISNDITNYINDILDNTNFTTDILTRDITITKEELNKLLKERYKHFPLFKRLEVISEKICDWFYEGKQTKKKTIMKLLQENLNLKKDYITIYNNFFKSKYSKIKQINNQITNKKLINYEDSSIYIYLKHLLEGINYNTDIRQVIIDEAQDYTKIQYELLIKIFKNANYTILGDINQTINPYYKYETLETIKDLLSESKYIELLKTYRSSAEIIEYTNHILNLNHISAIRKNTGKEVLKRNDIHNLKESLINDIKYLQKENKSIAIITKTDKETNNLYNILKEDINITKIDIKDNNYNRNLVILPAYIAKGLEFDSVIIYTDENNKYNNKEKYLFYVACTRAQHQLIVYNQ